MKQTHLKKIRVLFSLSFMALIFIGFLEHEPLSQWVSRTVLRFQFVPALVKLASGAGILFVVIFMLTMAFGRVYCSFLCPLGIFQDLISRLS